MEISPFIKTDCYIIGGDVSDQDGVMKHTPRENQPEHYTFWKVFDLDITHKFRAVREPASEE